MNPDLVKNVAKNARLDLTEEELARFSSELNEILESFEKIGSAEVDDGPVSAQPIKLSGLLREDTPRPSLSNEEATRNASNKKDGYFRGPRAF